MSKEDERGSITPFSLLLCLISSNKKKIFRFLNFIFLKSLLPRTYYFLTVIKINFPNEIVSFVLLY